MGGDEECVMPKQVIRLALRLQFLTRNRSGINSVLMTRVGRYLNILFEADRPIGEYILAIKGLREGTRIETREKGVLKG